MPTSKGKKSTTKPQEEKTSESHFSIFQTTINEFLKESQEKVVEIQKEFHGIVSDYQREYEGSKEEEYRRMVASIQESLGQEKSNELMEKAKEQFTANLEEKKAFIEKGMEEANEKYTKSLEKIAASNRKKYNDAFQLLLKALKSEVSGINLKDVDREALATIGQSMIMTSQYAPAV